MDRFWFESAVFDGKINYQVQITVESEVIREITVGVEKPLDVLHFDAMGVTIHHSIQEEHFNRRIHTAPSS